MPDIAAMEGSKKRKIKDGESSKVKKSKSKDKVGKQAAAVPVEVEGGDVTTGDAAIDAAQAPDAQTDAAGAPERGDEPPRKRSRKSGAPDPALPEIEVDVEAPTPLSKAQLRAARKEAKAAAKAGGSAPADEAGETSAAAAKPKKGKTDKKDKRPTKINSIWIGNLSFRTQADTLRSWIERNLTSLGETGEEPSVKEAIDDARKRLARREEKRAEKRAEREEEARKEGKEVRARKIPEEGEAAKGATWITRVNMPLKPGKGKLADNKGFAYVDFLTPALQTSALLLSERLLEGRKLLIKLGDDHAPAPDSRTPKPPTIVAGALPRKQPHDASSSLFMGNLDFASTEEEIRDLVEGNAIKAAGGKTADKGGKRKRGDESEEESEESSDDESESEEEEEDSETKPAANGVALKGANATKPRGGAVSGLVKVRVGQFEDTGRCKGFAFLDFKTVEAATFALANRANHFMRGRKLTLQYASQSATMRSSRAKRAVADGPRDADAPADGEDADDSPRKPFAKRARTEADASGVEPSSVLSNYTRPKAGGGFGGGGDRPPKPAFGKDRSNDTRGRKWEVAGRPRPGAALAMAKRENVAIVAGAGGKKTTFD